MVPDGMVGQASIKQEGQHEHDPYSSYPSMPPHHGMGPDHNSTLNGPHSQHMGHNPQHYSQQDHQHYQAYQNHHGMSEMSPLSPNYQGHPRGQHMQQYPQQYPGQQQMGMQQMTSPYPGQHMGGHMQGMMHGHHGHHEGREGDPYSFVDEYSGPPSRPVDEVLGQQPKRRGRKPKHIKLMENG